MFNKPTTSPVSMSGPEDLARIRSLSPTIATICEKAVVLGNRRGARLPLYVWNAAIPDWASDEDIEHLLTALDRRGIAIFSRWNVESFAESVTHAIRVGRIQKRLGLGVNVDATGVTNRFTRGERTGHIDSEGKRFNSRFEGVEVGCPFEMEKAAPLVKAQVEAFLVLYREYGVPLDFWAADWEVDGPIEWNDAWKDSQRCTRCREELPANATFADFQRILRERRSQLQREIFVKVVKRYFMTAMVGNYAINPHDGYRYWWDWFEKPAAGVEVAYKQDMQARHRPWAQEYAAAGYSISMPVFYTWYHIFADYPYANAQYRWLSGMLKEVSSTGRTIPGNVPSIPWVHWTTTNKPTTGVPRDFQAMDRQTYKELLWHALLRGHDTFLLWTPEDLMGEEIGPVHEVYAESLPYNEFILQGKPQLFEVPEQPGAVISLVLLRRQILVRRTDFTDSRDPVVIKVLGDTVQIPRLDHACAIIPLGHSTIAAR